MEPFVFQYFYYIFILLKPSQLEIEGSLFIYIFSYKPNRPVLNTESTTEDLSSNMEVQPLVVFLCFLYIPFSLILFMCLRLMEMPRLSSFPHKQTERTRLFRLESVA